MKREYAETSLLSLIALINEENGCNLDNVNYTYGRPSRYYETLPPETYPPPKLETTNTLVRVSNVRDRYDTRIIYYHRFLAYEFFAEATIEFDEGVNVPNDEQMELAVRNLLKAYGIPFETDTITWSSSERYLWIDFSSNYILSQSADVPIVTDTHLSRVIKVRTLTGYLEQLDVGVYDPDGVDTFMANLNKANGGTDYNGSNMYWGTPETIGLTSPTDRVLLTAPGIQVPYYGKTYIYYDRFPYDLERPNGIDVGSFADLAAFQQATSRFHVYELLRADSGYNFSGTEWTLTDYEESDTYPHFKLGVVFTGDCYTTKTVGTLYIVGGRAA